MTTDKEIIEAIDIAFMSVERPEHFTNYTHCEECAEHDELLRNRDRNTLSISDVGNNCWQPISFTTPEGIAYFIPALARLAIAPPTYEYGWYGDTLEIHLTSTGEENMFLMYCNQEQKRAIANFLKHLTETRVDLPERITSDEDMKKAVDIWSA